MKIIDREKLAVSIERRINEDIKLCNVGGASVLVAQDGEVIYKKHFGSSDTEGAEVTDGTLFRLASMTKPVTAVAAMILVDRGLLSLDSTVDSFYPAFKNVRVFKSGEAVTGITVKHLLTHTSGIGSGAAWNESYRVLTDSDTENVQSFVDFLSAQPISFLPGTKTEYSGVGAFSVLTGIIQQISGIPFSEFLSKEIFEPLGMTDTTFEPSEEQWERLIGMHGKEDGKSVVGRTWDGCVFEKFPPKSYLGGAGLVSSLSDYYRFASMLLDRGIYGGKRVLSEKAVSNMSTLHFPNNALEGWGLGVRVITDARGNVLPAGAFGWSGAYGTHFWIDRDNRMVAIYMKNSRFDGGAGAKTARNFEKDVYGAL